MTITAVETDVYMSPVWTDLFAQYGLDSFEVLWNASFDEVDLPNKSAEGWSSVSLIELEDNDGSVHRFYIKRQEAYNCFSFKAPMKGQPVFEREFASIQRFVKLGIPALTPVYFAKRELNAKPQAILITEALKDFVPMDSWLLNHKEDESAERLELAVALGRSVAKLHAAGLAHRALYSKHVFIKTDITTIDDSALAYIDLETARPHLGLLKFKLRDLSTLYRRSGLSNTEYRTFLQSYLGRSSWDSPCHKLLSRVEKTVAKKS